MIWLYDDRILLPKLPNIWKSSSDYYIGWKIFIEFVYYNSHIKFIIELGVSLMMIKTNKPFADYLRN